MRIAVYSGDIPSTTFIENLIDGLSSSGFEILLFGKQSQSVKYKGKVSVHPTPVSVWKLLPFIAKESVILISKNPKLFFKLIKTSYRKRKKLKPFLKDIGVLLPVLNNPPDVFHIQWAKTVEQYPELFELLNCKFALSLRGAHINYSPLSNIKLAEAYRKHFPSIDGFHAVSKAIGIEAMKYGADEKKIKVIHSSVREELLQTESLLFENNKTMEIISIGRFHWKKGYHYAIDAMNILSKEGMDFNFTIVAKGEIPEEIIFLIEEYKLKDKVKIIGGLGYDSLITKLRESDLLLLPSVEEGIANVVLEAMAVGVPVLTTDCGGMSEVIDDEISGYIVPVRNPEAIVLKVKEFKNSDADSKKKMTAKAKETIKKEFSKERQTSEFSNFYKSFIN